MTLKGLLSGGPMKGSVTPMFLLLIAPVAFPQNAIPSLTDDLLDHLVGRWEMTGTVHDRPSSRPSRPTGC